MNSSYDGEDGDRSQRRRRGVQFFPVLFAYARRERVIGYVCSCGGGGGGGGGGREGKWKGVVFSVCRHCFPIVFVNLQLGHPRPLTKELVATIDQGVYWIFVGLYGGL
jgi:hypothetical protein